MNANRNKIMRHLNKHMLKIKYKLQMKKKNECPLQCIAVNEKFSRFKRVSIHNLKGLVYGQLTATYKTPVICRYYNMDLHTEWHFHRYNMLFSLLEKFETVEEFEIDS